MKPYRYSRKAKRYIPTSKKSSRTFYYKRLSRLTGCNFDPNSTFGKFIMKRLISKLRKHRKCEKQILKFELEIDQKKENLPKEVNNYKSRIQRNYGSKISEIAKQYAHSEKNYLKYLNYIPIILSVIIFIPLCFYIGIVAFAPSFVIYLIIEGRVDNHTKKIINNFNDIAKSKYDGKLPRENVSNFRLARRKKIEEEKEALKPDRNYLEEIENSIERKLNTILNVNKIKFILSDQFYNSTDWISIRNEVLESKPNMCVECDSKKDLTVDHIKPRSKYPKLALKKSNTQILCRSCNSRKGNKVN